MRNLEDILDASESEFVQLLREVIVAILDNLPENAQSVILALSFKLLDKTVTILRGQLAKNVCFIHA